MWITGSQALIAAGSFFMPSNPDPLRPMLTNNPAIYDRWSKAGLLVFPD